MDNSKKNQLHKLAKDSLSNFEVIANTAREHRDSYVNRESDCLINTDERSLNAGRSELVRILADRINDFNSLISTPAIARIVVEDEKSDQKIYYICRNAPISTIKNLASYRAPIGRLASLDIGDEAKVGGKEYILIEKVIFNPVNKNNSWDSLNTVVSSDNFEPCLTIKSLRYILESSLEQEKITAVADMPVHSEQKQTKAEQSSISSESIKNDYILGGILNGDDFSSNVLTELPRNIIEKMQLREQPVLDKWQDEIFRLSLDEQLLIIGPPGAGKTTTLIRRLGQKLNISHLDDDEKQLVEACKNNHTASWLMFTPTELLKLYLKEAFSIEGIPAPEACVKTWSNYRRDLARSYFKLISSKPNDNLFVLRDAGDFLSLYAINNQIELFEEFNKFQQAAFLSGFRYEIYFLINSNIDFAKKIGENLLRLLKSNSSVFDDLICIHIPLEVKNVKSNIETCAGASLKMIRDELSKLKSENPNFVSDFLEFYENQPNNGEQPDKSFVSFYAKIAFACIKAKILNKDQDQMVLNAIKWLESIGASKEKIFEIGSYLIVLSTLKKIANPIELYFNLIPNNYQKFRRLDNGEKWYKSDINIKNISPIELDVLLLVAMRTAHHALTYEYIVSQLNHSTWKVLKNIFNLYKNQIFVDEATDFSPIQLACMAALTQPSIRSFFACGDFNQRLTVWGTRNLNELQWAVNKIKTKEITITYRQSQPLYELAKAVILSTNKENVNVVLPHQRNNQGVPPALLERADNDALVVAWLAKRIQEIEQTLQMLPSIAVFVESESKVQSIADALNEELSLCNIHAVACHKGQIIGVNNEVRVFDVQHIKGLEFEAVFFVDVDCLAKNKPDLFDKYLYVGITRAATYLGLTCASTLPEAIGHLKSSFVDNWI